MDPRLEAERGAAYGYNPYRTPWEQRRLQRQLWRERRYHRWLSRHRYPYWYRYPDYW